MLTDSEVVQVFHGLWEQGRAPGEWAGDTEPDENLIWRAGHPGGGASGSATDATRHVANQSDGLSPRLDLLLLP